MPKQIHSISGYQSTRLTSGIRKNLQTGGKIQQRGCTLDKQPRLSCTKRLCLKQENSDRGRMKTLDSLIVLNRIHSSNKYSTCITRYFTCITRCSKYCRIIHFRGGQISWIVGFLGMEFRDASVFSFCRKTKLNLINQFSSRMDINSWVRATHEFNEN